MARVSRQVARPHRIRHRASVSGAGPVLVAGGGLVLLWLLWPSAGVAAVPETAGPPSPGGFPVMNWLKRLGLTLGLKAAPSVAQAAGGFLRDLLPGDILEEPTGPPPSGDLGLDFSKLQSPPSPETIVRWEDVWQLLGGAPEGTLGIEGAQAAIQGYGLVGVAPAEIAGMTGSELGSAVAAGALETAGATESATAAVSGTLASVAPYALVLLPLSIALLGFMSGQASLSPEQQGAINMQNALRRWGGPDGLITGARQGDFEALAALGSVEVAIVGGWNSASPFSVDSFMVGYYTLTPLLEPYIDYYQRGASYSNVVVGQFVLNAGRFLTQVELESLLRTNAPVPPQPIGGAGGQLIGVEIGR